MIHGRQWRVPGHFSASTLDEMMSCRLHKGNPNASHLEFLNLQTSSSFKVRNSMEHLLPNRRRLQLSQPRSLRKSVCWTCVERKLFVFFNSKFGLQAAVKGAGMRNSKWRWGNTLRPQQLVVQECQCLDSDASRTKMLASVKVVKSSGQECLYGPCVWQSSLKDQSVTCCPYKKVCSRCSIKAQTQKTHACRHRLSPRPKASEGEEVLQTADCLEDKLKASELCSTSFALNVLIILQSDVDTQAQTIYSLSF